jgi:tetratricopeptide (TPR) repeat protein
MVRILYSFLFILLGCQSASVDVASIMQNGKAAFKAGKYDEAIVQFEKVVRVQPKNQEAQYFLGYAYSRTACAHGGMIMDLNEPKSMKAVEHLGAAIQIDPKYRGELVVLDPYAKLTSEWGMVAMYYAYKDDVAQAIDRMKAGRQAGAFNDALLEYNRNMLNSCEPNAILFTNGDMDTFPVFYIQAVENCRRDVTVVNVSLLNTSWYIKKMKQGYPFGANGIPVQLDAAAIEALKPELFKQKEMDIAFVGGKNQSHRYTWTMAPTVENRAIRVQDQMVLHLIEQNRDNRPIYFAATVEENNLIGLNKYLVCEGLALRLQDKADETKSQDCLTRHLNSFTFNSIVKGLCDLQPNACGLVQNYRSVYLRTAQAVAKQGDRNRARQLLDDIQRLLPADAVPHYDKQLEAEIVKCMKEWGGGR